MEILPDGPKADGTVENVASSRSGSIEFNFDTSDSVTGLVFMESDDAEAPEPINCSRDKR